MNSRGYNSCLFHVHTMCARQSDFDWKCAVNALWLSIFSSVLWSLQERSQGLQENVQGLHCHVLRQSRTWSENLCSNRRSKSSLNKSNLPHGKLPILFAVQVAQETAFDDTDELAVPHHGMNENDVVAILRTVRGDGHHGRAGRR
eukprot:IDg4816t1